MNFQKHTSRELVSIFNSKPYQGQVPEKARIVFLSSDANYSPEITNNPFFTKIIDYHKNGVEFWKKNDCHHPFLLEDYPLNKNTGGVPFHRNFNKIGLKSDYAEYISFLELLDVPTIGIKSKDKKIFYDMVSIDHLRYLENLMCNSMEKFFFVSAGVIGDFLKFRNNYGFFLDLDFDKLRKGEHLPLAKGNFVVKIPHFSSYKIHGELENIRKTVDKWLAGNNFF